VQQKKIKFYFLTNSQQKERFSFSGFYLQRAEEPRLVIAVLDHFEFSDIFCPKKVKFTKLSSKISKHETLF
jgi:hypothetical protein